jgi:hypothetical protein
MGGISFLVLVLTSIHIWIKTRKNNMVSPININLPLEEDSISEHQVEERSCIEVPVLYNNNRYNKEIISTLGFGIGSFLFLVTFSTWVNNSNHNLALMYVQDVGPTILSTFILPLCLYAKKKNLRKFVSDCM